MLQERWEFSAIYFTIVCLHGIHVFDFVLFWTGTESIRFLDESQHCRTARSIFRAIIRANTYSSIQLQFQSKSQQFEQCYSQHYPSELFQWCTTVQRESPYRNSRRCVQPTARRPTPPIASNGVTLLSAGILGILLQRVRSWVLVRSWGPQWLFKQD